MKTLCCWYNSPVGSMGELMRRFVEEADRGQWTLLPECLDDLIDESNPVIGVVDFCGRRWLRLLRALGISKSDVSCT
jgi:hypothetical protein